MDYLAALLPSAGLLVLFVLLIRSVLHADRRERAAAARARSERAAATESPAPREGAS
ncbi:hypothetical protein [Kineococcus vitellinus]|uniref:hypothetical protein n=1 Tax=Kineococcus vitellinus TaxID=2696565 RepID=UPI0014127BEB|nr:hypothetical protein [Kineococcus vitellinus]